MKKKIAVITGGTGRIGSVFIKSLLEKNYMIYNLSSNKNNFDKKLNNKNIVWVKFDLKKPNFKKIKFFFNKTSIDCLINCAAYSNRSENIKYTNLNFYDEIKGVFGSSVQLTEILIKNLRKKGGIIINVGSIWGIVAPDFRTYLDLNNSPSPVVSIGKAAIIQYSKYLASREAKYKIRVNNLIPGFFPKPGKTRREDYIHEIKKRTILSQIGQPEYLKPAIDFLLSDANIFYTAQNLIVDGGYTSW